MDKTIFKINFNEWRLLINPENGNLEEPVPKEEFSHYEYWSDQFNQPVRQIICKNNSSNYADYLNLKTAALYRRAQSLLGCSAFDDEIDKKQYEDLCQKVLLKERYTKLVNYDILLPYQSLSLSYYYCKNSFVIEKTKKYYEINFTELKLEEVYLSQDDIVHVKTISEYEYYYNIFNILKEKYNYKIS